MNMIRNILPILLVLLILPGGCVPQENPATPPTEEKQPPPEIPKGILVNEIPEGADIRINSRPEGTTPTAVRNLPLGEELTVRIEKDGYQPYITPVLLSADNPESSIKAVLKKK